MSEDIVFALVVIAIMGGLTFLIAIHEFGHLIAAKLSKVKVTDFFVGFGPKIFSFKKGDTTYGLAAILFGGYVKLVGSDVIDQEEKVEEGSLLKAPLRSKLFIILMGATMNILAAFIILAVALGFRGVGQPTNVVAGTEKGSPAYKVLKPSDRILEIEDRKIDNWNTLSREIKKYPNKKVVFRIKRGNSIKLFSIRLTVRENKGFLGIEPETKRIRSLSIGESIKASMFIMYFMTLKISFLIFGALTGQAAPLVKSSTSIVGAVYIGAKQTKSFLDYLSIIGYFSFILAYINLLPIPPLDAGRAVLYIIEKIKGRPIRKNITIAINALGLVFLLTMFILLLAKDLIGGLPNV